ncbi:MAG: SMC-Scp complex subunit ScpB [Pseudomonadota bacterium]|nr:SMC-Scp complex subunit ScpB [Pseudomonadota bacterium]
MLRIAFCAVGNLKLRDKVRDKGTDSQWLPIYEGRSFTVDGLREKVREFYREEVRGEARAAAALTNVELITALLECNRQLGVAGLQMRIINGVVSPLTTKVENQRLAEYLREQTGASGNPELTTATLEVLGCIVFKQPISQAEIDRLFAADKRAWSSSCGICGWWKSSRARTDGCGLPRRRCLCSF